MSASRFTYRLLAGAAFAALAILLLQPPPAAGQAVTGTLSGTIVDGNTTGRDGGGIFFAGQSASVQTLVIEDAIVHARLSCRCEAKS